MDNPGDVDELLLPMLDFDYTAYKQIIFDTTLNTPSQYLQKIDNQTYIIKYPISHPLPEGGTLGIEYLYLDVSVLIHIMSVSHTIWQNNIYVFGAMDMRSAVAAMIGYIQDYVDTTMPVEFQADCYRIIRLFRWYGEAAILKNSEYQVSIVYGQWNSNLMNDTMDIPYTLTNLYINTSKFIIQNTIINVPSTLEMSVNNNIDTTFSFQYAMSSGDIEVYINDILVSQSTGMTGIVENELVATENTDVNDIKIVYNNGGTISLGNIIINEYNVTDMTMTYNPNIGSGNSIMNELLTTLGVFADVADTNSPYIQSIINGNYAVTETIDNLQNYFATHHQDKVKGKRLITKK
jgi:hypothetical protein